MQQEQDEAGHCEAQSDDLQTFPTHIILTKQTGHLLRVREALDGEHEELVSSSLAAACPDSPRCVLATWPRSLPAQPLEQPPTLF